jgi:hypothetical protein
VTATRWRTHVSWSVIPLFAFTWPVVIAVYFWPKGRAALERPSPSFQFHRDRARLQVLGIDVLAFWGGHGCLGFRRTGTNCTTHLVAHPLNAPGAARARSQAIAVGADVFVGRVQTLCACCKMGVPVRPGPDGQQ